MKDPFIKKMVANKITKHILYWLGFVLFFTIIWGTSDQNYFRNLMIQLYSLPSRLILVYVTLFCLVPVFFIKKRYILFIVLYFVLLIGISVLIQRPIMLYLVQPTYLPDWDNSNFFVITEIMNTILDMNIAAVIPLGYIFFKVWRKSQQRNLELEKNNLKLTLDKDDIYIYLKVEKSLQKVFIKDIIFIESLKNYIKVKTIDREIIAYKSISSIQNTLPSKKFLRVHRSYIVGLDFIDSFSPSQINLKGIIIPIGRKYKDSVKKNLGYF